MIPIGKSVAMKFIETGGEFGAEHEYKMYTYLNAINNSTVELYGIPTVYYYGTWNEYTLTAITLFEYSVLSEHVLRAMGEVDLFIILKEFVSRSCALGLGSYFPVETFHFSRFRFCFIITRTG